jgi:DNA-binding beta-propeller fold protein YncE
MSRQPRQLWRALAFGAVLAVVAVSAPLGRVQAPAQAAPTAEEGGAVVLPDGRLVRPDGRRFDLGDFPIGLAVSPDGRLAVAANAGQGFGNNFGFGSFCDDLGKPNQCGQAPSSLVGDPATPTPDESLSVVDLAHGGTATVTVVPTSHDPSHPGFNFFSGWVAFDPSGAHLYATGGGNDALYDFPVSGGALGTPRVAQLPSTLGSLPPFPFLGKVAGYTRGLAVTPDGATVLVLKEFDDELDVVDASTLTVRQRLPLGQPTPVGGGYPYAVAVAPAGDRAYVSLQGSNVLDVIALGATGARVAGVVPVGDHPTGLAVTPDGGQVLVANADDDSLAVVDAAAGQVVQRLTLKGLAGEAVGSVPNAVALTRDGARAFVALAGDNAVAVLDRSASGWHPAGNLPTGWYPTAVAVRPSDGSVLAVAAKGLGSRYPADGAYPVPTVGGPSAIPTSYYYDASNMPGLLTQIDAPNRGDLVRGSLTVAANLRFASRADRRPPHSPVPPVTGGDSPISHVVYIVRENRTFDQVFGDLAATRSDVDADPRFQLLAPATPNAHALAGRYAISDRFFSDGEASIQGHWWTSAANTNDYTEKAWRQYYSARNRPNDPIAPIATPKGCTLFQAAQARHAATGGAFTFRNYGELVGTAAITLTPSPGLGQVPGCLGLDPASTDPNYPNQLTPISFDDRKRAAEFLGDVGLDAAGSQVGDPATHFLRNLSYLILPQDHTTGAGGPNTPRAQVAQNDNALGTIVSALSKSKYWRSTAVFVVEDDSQDGPDHVDGHRNILLLASPWARHQAAEGDSPGYVGHRRYDQAGVVRTIELILGLRPLSAHDQLAAPTYDLFQNLDRPDRLGPVDLAPFEVAQPPPFIDEPISAIGSQKAAELRRVSGTLDLGGIDRAGPGLEAVLWMSVRDDPPPAELQRRLQQPAAATDPD